MFFQTKKIVEVTKDFGLHYESLTIPIYVFAFLSKVEIHS